MRDTAAGRFSMYTNLVFQARISRPIVRDFSSYVRGIDAKRCRKGTASSVDVITRPVQFSFRFKMTGL